jgi:integrase
MSDQRVSGHLKIVERTSGSVYYIKSRVPGRTPEQTTRRLGPAWKGGGRPPKDHYTRRMAEDALAAYLVDERRKVGIGAYGGGEAGSVTFREAAAEYLRFVEHVRRRDRVTRRDYEGVVHGYLLNAERLAELRAPELSDMRLAAITPDHVDAYKEALILEGRLSPRTVVRHLTVLHGIFKRAKRVWGLATNPASADLVERPALVYTGEFDTYTREELDLLTNAAASDMEAALYRTAAFTGLRQGELFALRWRDIDLVVGLVHVRRNYTGKALKVPKGKKARSVPATPEVVDALAGLKDREYFTGDDDLVFCTVLGGFLDDMWVRRRYYRAIDDAGLRRIRFHDLRHCFGSMAITVLDGYAVQSYMGHQHYSTTQRYLHHKPRPQDAELLHCAFAGDPVSPAVSRNGDIERNSAQLADAETPE